MSKKNLKADISSNRQISFEMTQEKYDEMRARGIEAEAIPEVKIHRLKRLNKRISPAESKVVISLEVDGDVLQHFHQRAQESDAESYQTLINAELREVMKRDFAESDAEMKRNIELLSKNKEFILAIAKQTKEIQAA